MIRRPDQRVAVFIDTQNMYHSAKHLFNGRVNFGAVVDAAVGERHLIRAIAYVAKSKTGEEQAFFDALLQSGIELKIKDVQEFASGQKKADWDVGMTVDAICISPRVDVVVLITGDGDFVPLVEYLHSHGVMCEVVAFGESTNAKLREVCDAFLDVSEDPKSFLIHAHGGPKKHTDMPDDDEDENDLAKLMEDSRPEKRPIKPIKPPHIPTKPADDGGSRKIRVTF